MAFYRSTETITIAASPQRAYQALTDWKARAAWRPGLSLRWDGPDQAVVGQVLRFRVAGFPPSFFAYRVTGLEPGRLIYMEYQAPPLRGRAAVEISPQGEGCRVSFHWMKVEPVGVLARLYFALGLGPASHRQETRKTLAFLKRSLEKTPGA